jgi:hypothetical protein
MARFSGSIAATRRDKSPGEPTHFDAISSSGLFDLDNVGHYRLT